MIYYKYHFLSQDCNSALYCISNLYLNFENDMQFILILFYLSDFISLPIFFISMVFMLPWGVCHRSFKVTRRVFNLSQRRDSLASPLVVGR